MDLIDPHNAQEIFFDGASEVKIIEAVTRIVLFSKQNATGVIVARLALPLTELPEFLQMLAKAMTEAARGNPTGM